MTTRDQIRMKVQAILMDALGVDEEDVSPDASLFKNLGAESIDLLDIVFRLERTFGISIARGELFPENLSTPAFVEDGRLTPQGLEEIRKQIPSLDLTPLECDPRVDVLLDLYTVASLTDYVACKLIYKRRHMQTDGVHSA